MSFDAKTLYALLPAIYRLRDAEQDGVLRDLMAVIAEQVAVIEEDFDQLYDDQFIETCADWVAPYIGGLIGYRTLHGVVPTVSSPRAEVANTIAYRRRKGTASVLEQLAQDVTGWNAHVVEFFERLAAVQYLNHLRPHAAITADLRSWEGMERLGTAFDRLPHGVDVRSIARGRGRHNISNVGLFLWRLDAFPLERAMPARLDDRRFRFNPLGIDMPLFTNPATEPHIAHLASPLNVPAPISRRVLAARDAVDGGGTQRRLDRYYGAGRSLLIETRAAPGEEFAALASGDIEVCNLSDRPGDSWSLAGPSRAVAIDPVLGRLLLRDAPAAGSELRVSFHHGFSGPMGGGQYERAAVSVADLAAGLPVIRVSEAAGDQPTIQAGLDELAGTGGIVEIADNRTYAETLNITVPAGGTLILRAANERRPTLVLAADLAVTVNDAAAEASLMLDGLVIAGGAVVLAAAGVTGLRRLVIRDSTLVPGRTLAADGTPAGAAPSLIADIAGTDIRIERSVVGGLRISALSQASITDSIVDATAASALAYAGPAAGTPGGSLTLVSSTVIGGLFAEQFALVSNAIVVAEPGPDTTPVPVRAERLQQGCVRFSYVPPASATPSRYRCQPDQEVAAATERRQRETGAELSDAQAAALRAGVLAWLKPSFTSRRYGRPGYGQLATRCPAQIRSGADDEAEMGAFHTLFQSQRETNLKVRVEEYLRFGLEAGLFYET
ncbi:hypothetical protein [Ancylobacter defluvii]|uniref:Phage tail protein (Tail_P2_I) n=1 Tax=Ancylobacter defluvii TaxID=1282440 RepID=A0A9W6JXQ2_9HYPH|nr:hypothetical protein [Ancylobacter defluvii]MBS7588544.1 hypothetical protein [Ancylobacter defluvii]GLK83824.1 hypothetical protein GCM10017653_18940 [Ancylobacter defluvii]